MSKANPDLYLLVDGTHADPNECDVGADHMLRHANGVPVALREDGTPQTLGGNASDSGNVQAAAAEQTATVAEDAPAKPTQAKAKPTKAKAPPAAKPAKPKNREIRTR